MQDKVLLFITFFFILMKQFSGFAVENTSPDGKIKGAVAEAKTEEPVEYATVALYRVIDNELITGTITDHLGHFKIDQPESGEYYLIIKFIGLEDITTGIFTIEDDHSNINLGIFFLKSSINELDGVEIVAKRTPVEYRIDKKVINVDKQITAEAGTAVDVLENIPSIQVDVEGNVTLRGSSGFSVLIDGKPTILEPSDVLRQIPSSSIENIEIITNPSVKYEPDGATGIINIITKKNRLDGLSGIANVNAGLYGQYGGDIQMNYRMNKVNLIFGANYNKRNRPGYMTDDRITLSNDTSYFVESFGDTERGFENKSIRLGLEYDITKNDFISVSGRYGRWDMSSSSTLRYNEWTDPTTELFSFNSLENTLRGGAFYSLDGIYQHTFTRKKTEEKIVPVQDGKPESSSKSKKAGNPSGYKAKINHIINLEVLYRNRRVDESTTNELRDLSENLIGGKKNIENGPSESIRINIDYTLPIGAKDKFEAGGQLRNGQSNDMTELWLYDTATNNIEIVDEFSNNTNYNRNIYAVYGLYAGYLGDFGYQAGLRTEFMNRSIEMTGENEFNINRWDYFPTVHLSYNLPNDQQLMLSYSRRIDRPRSWWLEPFITWVDAYNVRQGNPALQPEYIDSYELGYLKQLNEHSVSLESYYRITHNKVERISTVFQENVMMTRPENVGNDYSLGIEAMINLGIYKWWNMELSGNFFQYKLDGELSYVEGNEIIVDQINQTSTNWNSRFINTFQLWKNGEFQLSYRYNSASVTAQGKSLDYYTLDAALRVSFLNRSLSANIQGRDLLGTSRRERISEGPGFYTHYKYDPKSPVVVLTLSYRFNNYKVNRRSGQNNGDSGDEF